MIIQGVSLNGVRVVDATAPTSGLVLYLDANQSASYSGSGTTVNDLSGNGYTNSLSGAVYNMLNGVKCFECTTGNNRVVVNGTGPLLPTTGYTYITWARLIAASSFRTLLYTNSPKYTPITIPNGTNTLGYWDSAFRTSNYDLASSVDAWVQYAVVGTNSSQTFYINGSQVGNSIAYGAGGTTHWGWGNNDTAGQPWGQVANLKLYNVQLTEEQIRQDYYNQLSKFTTPSIVTSNLVLWYDPSFSTSYPGTGTSVTNLANTSLPGTLSNITYTDPYFTYNGSSATLSVADNSLLEPGTGDFTVEAWVYYSAFSGSSRVILAKTDGGNSADWSYGIRTLTSGATYMEVGNGTTTVTTPTFTVSTGQWYQIVGVWTNVASNSIALYVNGVSVGSNSHSFASVKNSTRPLYFGSFDGGATFGQWFNGRMGVTRMYSSALSAAQVLQNYNADKSKYGL